MGQDTNYEIVQITGVNPQHVELESEEEYVLLHTAGDGDDPGASSLKLSIAEAEELIAKLAVKVAQARMWQTAEAA